ncbi:MAG: HlyD family efflux transporter periplasmic adaptor subunit [Chloroflexi bacterium]|nr:HlyD family efflux transporter periplasmic adaptor subunit [Chloroflexota bacterium]
MSRQYEGTTDADKSAAEPATVDALQGGTEVRRPGTYASRRPGGPAAPAAPSARRLPPLLLPIVLVLLVAGALIVYRYWYNDAFYVSTDNAKVVGALIQVGALNAGRIESITVDVGNSVQQDQLLTTITMPSAVSIAQGTPKMSFLGTDDLRVEVRSPISGEVVARQANAGDTVAAGQPVLTLVDPNALWVVANIEETKIGRVKRGQKVEVHVDALGQTFTGHVGAITPATAATFSLLPQQNGSGNFTKTTQLVPVKIMLDAEDRRLPLGGSVEARIQVAEPARWLPWRP